MKNILTTLLLIISCNCLGQKIALLNLNFEQPIIYTDSVTVQQVSSGLFPVSINDFDTLYANLDYLRSMFTKLQRSKMKSFELHSGSTTISVNRAPFSHGDRYLTIAKTKIGEVESKINLAPVDRSNAKNSERMKKIMAYMKSNKSLFRIPYPVEPKLTNIVVITE